MHVRPVTFILAFFIFHSTAFGDEMSEALVTAAHERTQQNIIYDPSYRSMEYPMGDVPAHTGVCTDVIIRSYRKLGIDLQALVHEDMAQNFAAYPDVWGLSKPDTNIDHRRVPNLQTFFARQNASLPATNDPGDYQPGDVVTWMLPGNLPHTGIVVDKNAPDGVPLIVHNIGHGPKLENIQFSFPISGHYRYFPKPQS